MSANDTPSTQDRPGEESELPICDAIASTETYETDEGVVFYDADNPLAWLQARATLRLDEMC